METCGNYAILYGKRQRQVSVRFPCCLSFKETSIFISDGVLISTLIQSSPRFTVLYLHHSISDAVLFCALIYSSHPLQGVFPSNVQQIGVDLVIMNAARVDNGIYLCHVNNSAGVAYKLLQVIVGKLQHAHSYENDRYGFCFLHSTI